jgi:pilus assembly protein CpaF
VGAIVDVTARLVARLLDSDVPLHRDVLTAEAVRLLPDEAPLAGMEDIVDAVDMLVGLGPVERVLRRGDVSDVLVNAPDEVWMERNGVLEPAPVRYRDAADIEAAVQRVIAPLGLRLDRASPAVDARLADGSRLHALIPPASVDGPVFAVRRFTEAVPDLDGLIAAGSIDAQGASVLRSAVADRRNLVVAGGTGTGKTTLLNVLSKEIPSEQRVVTIEDAAELRLTGHVVRLEARPPNAEGAGEITVRALLKHALRLRPDRIVVGEVRGPEALDMVQALSSGHAGSMSTVHAEDAEQALLRITSLALSSGEADARVVRRQLRSAIDVVVVVARRDGRRFVRSVEAVSADGVDPVWRC